MKWKNNLDKKVGRLRQKKEETLLNVRMVTSTLQRILFGKPKMVSLIGIAGFVLRLQLKREKWDRDRSLYNDYVSYMYR